MSTDIIDIKYSLPISGDFQFPYRVSVKICIHKGNWNTFMSKVDLSIFIY